MNITKNGLVGITDRGKPSDALATHDEFGRLTGSLVGSLAMPGQSAIDFVLPRVEIRRRDVDLS
ncbi:prevent-host-death protein [Sinorhizobium meliloti]|uniref:prevent-host-death protein n=1 Tax=Rhizobium meliloti TaxID=382 RepID=UPI000FDAD8BD|nr:prevent-host-death protein [Sinorhizobium meliloti]MDW9361066.1 prevent-host-death protein [Sinorhizobium meliloti]MDW9384840.1 prevent-host-death protein [Sinorhizobium meliloti]MDW9407205.1 prevent-host-death protein [Sinorhizobium meliloti]MDW9452679.1 prevent-host-death protein [Sinorhizobium meliloti]MDW9465316.1 prevent-host-death protein [Sinorhizobium meliloti]